MYQNHCACCQADAVDKQPVEAKVSDIGADVGQLTHRLSYGKDQGCQLLVQLEPGPALGPLLALQLLQGGEAGGQQLQDDGCIDVRHNPCTAHLSFCFSFLTASLHLP